MESYFDRMFCRTTCNESELGCFEEGAQYTAEKPMGLSPKLPFIVKTRCGE